MTPEIFAEWQRRQGRVVVETASSIWVEVGPRIFQAFPYHMLISPSEEELNKFLQKERAVGLRYSTPLETPSGAVSYHVMLDAAEYRLETLPKKARYDVRKGLEATEIEPVSFLRMADESWQLRRETLQRQGREKAEAQSWWEKLCHSADGLPGFEAWAAIHQNSMVASLIAFTCDETCSILYQQSSTEYLSQGVNNALAFAFSQQVLSRPHIKRIFYGLHSLDAPPTVDQFKLRMGFTAKPIRQRVVFHPALAPLFNASSYAMIKGLSRLRPSNATLAKAEGMVRFFIEGNKPIEKQTFPRNLDDQKEQIISSALA